MNTPNRFTTTGSSRFREWIREQKNRKIQQYFHWRVAGKSDPYRVLFRKQPYRILFILSHMRSGSSLLTHLVNANPQIIGYGETHLEYASKLDFTTLIEKVYWRAQEFRALQDMQNLHMRHAYVMDKVLHDQKFLSCDFLKDPQVYSIFLLRDPARSLTSMMDLKPHWNEQAAIDYYVGRLRTLVQYAQFIENPQRALVITYEQLLEDTPTVLSLLQQFLQTQTPFSEEYQVLKTTGMKGIGDSKGNIKAGRILRSQRPLSQPISNPSLEYARTQYETAWAQLSQYCTAINQKASMQS